LKQKVTEQEWKQKDRVAIKMKRIWREPPDKTHPEDLMIASQQSPQPTAGSRKKEVCPKSLLGI
jgi:hypothetical protein